MDKHQGRHFILILLLAALANCHHAVPGQLGPKTQSTVGLSLVADELDSTAIPYRCFSLEAQQISSELLIKQPILICHVERVEKSTDEYGGTSFYLWFTREDAVCITKFTGDHVNQRMAVIVNEMVVSSPIIVSPLPGEVKFYGMFTSEEVLQLEHALSRGGDRNVVAK